jgi:cephalosporin hydroxylase
MAEDDIYDLTAPNGRSFKQVDWFADLSDILFIGMLKLRYRGVPMFKTPFDVAIYMQLFSKGKPKSILEIGSHRGASALFFADMLRMKVPEGRVVSVDLELPPFARDERVTFLKGDARKLEEVFTPELLASLPHPWMVSEDSAHTYETTIAVLNFFRDKLEVGDYIVVEDGGATDMAKTYPDGGPNRAVHEFLSLDDRYEPDPDLCDMFGYNATGHPNGYLRRVK